MDLAKPARRGRGGVGFRLLALGGVIAVLVAGCGGSSTPTKTTKKQTANKTSVSKPKASTTAAPSTSGASKSSSSSSTAPTFASTGNCSQLAGVGQQFSKAMAAATSGGKFNLSAAVAAYKHLADASPSAIRPDLETIATALTSYAEAISKAGFKPGHVPSPTQIAAIEAAAKTLSASKLESASKAVENWAVKNCSA